MSWITVGVAAAGALAGKAKNDRMKSVESSDRKLASETQRYSPWTGLHAQAIRPANSAFGDVFSGGVQGAMMGNSISNGLAGMGGSAPDPLADPNAQYQPYANPKGKAF